MLISGALSTIISSLAKDKIPYVNAWISFLAVLNTWVAGFFFFQMLWVEIEETTSLTDYITPSLFMYFFIVNPLIIALLEKRMLLHFKITIKKNFLVVHYLNILILPVISYGISVYISWLITKL